MIESLFNINGKTAIITGGTGVLGGALAKALADVGVKVGILGRRAEVANQRVEEIKAAGGEAIALIADVLDKESLEKANEKMLATYGKIDILINGAGGNMPGATIMPNQSFSDLSFEDLKKVIDLNQIGTILPTQIFLKNMIERREGCIINITSMAAIKPLTRVVGYAASKASINNFTEWMAVEMAQRHGEGIRVNAIAPGFFITEQNHSLLLNENGDITERGKKIIDHTPMGRFGQPEELIGTTIWLCSEASKFVTGICVPVDGGFNAFSGV